MNIRDAQTHVSAAVNAENRLRTESVTSTEELHEAYAGFAYNINTGTIGLTAGTVSGVLYFKNQEDHAIVVAAVAVGIGNGGAPTDKAEVKIIRNPTSVSFSAAVDMNSNRNFSSNKTLKTSTLAYKGAEGATVTGGTESLLFYQGAGRLYAGIDLVLDVGASLAVTIDPNVSSGTCNVYAALVCYVSEEH